MISVKNISHQIGQKTILSDISFDINPGEFLVIIGPNGAGKTTLLKSLCKDFKPQQGSINFLGRDLEGYRTKELARIRSVLTQSNEISINYKVEELVGMGRYPHYENRPQARDLSIIRTVMEELGIMHLKDRDYYSLSGGEKQRVQLARVLVQIHDQDTSVLFLDEPINGLDLLYQQLILEEARKYARKGRYVISILHDLNLASQYADKVLVLKEGKMVSYGRRADTITEKTITETYNTRVKLVYDPQIDYPLIVPLTSLN